MHGFLVLAVSLSAHSLTTSAMADDQSCEVPESLDVEAISKRYMETRPIFGAVYSERYEHPCLDMAASACTRFPPMDPTGSVVPVADAARSKARRELMANQIKDLAKKQSTFPDKDMVDKEDYIREEYIKANHFEERLQEFDEILKKAKESIKKLLRRNIKNKAALQEAIRKLDAIVIARDYKSYPEELFSYGAGITKGLDGSSPRIYVGGEFMRTTTSLHSRFFILAHELGHSIAHLRSKWFPAVDQCLGAKPSNSSDAEVWSDQVATQAYADFLPGLGYSPPSTLSSLKNVARRYCGYGGSNTTHPDGTTIRHPDGKSRIAFFMSNPKLHKLACAAYPNVRREKNYCNEDGKLE